MTPEYLEELADIADPKQLWRLPVWEQQLLPPEEHRQLDMGVALRRHASFRNRLRGLLGEQRSLLITPLANNYTAECAVETPPNHDSLRPSYIRRHTGSLQEPHCGGHDRFDHDCIDCSDALERQRTSQQVDDKPRDREDDRRFFPDPEFNAWLDQGISDCGHTVWDAVGDVQAAWEGWQAARHAEQPGGAVQAAPAGVDCLELLPWSDFWQRQGRPDVSHNFAAFELAEAWATACISAAGQHVRLVPADGGE